MRKIIIINIFFVIAILFHAAHASAATYYVDFESGSDSNAGTSISSPWKHSPGDSNATGIAASAVLASGDKVIFKGGVSYRGSIALKWSGTDGGPIVFDGNTDGNFGNGKAIIDGSELLTGWTKCESQDVCLGNPNWQNIYYVPVPFTPKTWAGAFFENNEMLWVSQDPNQPDPFWIDEEENYRLLSLDGEITTTTIKDSSFFNQTDPNYYSQSYIAIWRQFNVIDFRKINSFDPLTNTISFDALGQPPYTESSRKRFSLLNHIKILDTPGEYYYDQQNSRVYIWPKSSGSPQNITISTRGNGFNLNGMSNITIQGFKIQKHSENFGQYTEGIAILNPTYKAGENIVIKDNEITLNRFMEARHGGIEPTNMKNVLIENNYIHDEQRGTGMQLVNLLDAIVQNNIVDKVGSVGIWVMGSKNIALIKNQISKIFGSHTDAVAFYLYSQNILFYDNKIFDAEIGISMEDGENYTLYNNIVDLGSRGYLGFVLWGGAQKGDLNILNNVVLGSSSNNAIAINDQDPEINITIINNIIDGGGNAPNVVQRSHNIYTDLRWDQDSNYGWQLVEGEIIEKDLSAIFVDYANRNFNLKTGSSAIDVGIDITPYLPVTIFSSIDLNKDMADVSRPQGAAWDVGAYEYCASGNCSGGGGGNGGDTGGNMGGSGGDTSSGGSGCGFVKDNGKGQKAKDEGRALAMMLIITLAGIALARRIFMLKKSTL